MDLTPGQCSQPPHGITINNNDNQYWPPSPYSHPSRYAHHKNRNLMFSYPHIYGPQPVHANDSHMTAFVSFLAQHELVTTGLLQFNDQPESYSAW